jgi:hypothetical protein
MGLEGLALIVFAAGFWLVSSSVDFITNKTGLPDNFRLWFVVITFWIFALGIPFSFLTTANP